MPLRSPSGSANLGDVVGSAYEFFDRMGISQRAVIVVDDGSTDETYFATRSPAIETLFPGLLLYLGVLLLVFGNFVLFLQHVAVATKHEGFSTVKYMIVVLTGIWPMMTVASLAKACYELANPRMRHFWDKTEHGHDLHTLDRAVGGLRSVGSADGEAAPAGTLALPGADVAAAGIAGEFEESRHKTA